MNEGLPFTAKTKAVAFPNPLLAPVIIKLLPDTSAGMSSALKFLDAEA